MFRFRNDVNSRTTDSIPAQMKCSRIVVGRFFTEKRWQYGKNCPDDNKRCFKGKCV